MKGPVPITRSKLLLGEGVEELRVFQAMLEHVGLGQEIQVMEYGGKSKLGPYLRALRATHGFNQLVSLGITRDADNSAEDARLSVEGLVSAADFPAALNVQSFVLPGSGRGGALEDLCLDAVAMQPVWPCVGDLVGCRVRVLGEWPASATLAKAKIQAWLSTQNEPGLRLGEAAAKGLLPFNSPAFEFFIGFLRSL